jgi:hypothetical protein
MAEPHRSTQLALLVCAVCNKSFVNLDSVRNRMAAQVSRYLVLRLSVFKLAGGGLRGC